MKQLISIFKVLLITAMTFTDVSCSDSKESIESQLIVSVSEMSFSRSSGLQPFHIKTNTKWTVSSSADWCTLSPTSGAADGTFKVEVSVNENTLPASRTAIITVVAGGVSQEVKVIQAASDLLLLEKSDFDVDQKGGTIAVKMKVAGDYTVTINNDWITKSVLRAAVDKEESFNVAANNSFMHREGTIDIKVGTLTETVVIRQKGTGLYIPADKTGMLSDASALAKKMKIGWNLGNTLDATSATTASETLWGNPKTTKQLIDGVKAAGFNTVRIPCAWSAYIEDASTYRIKESWLARVKEVVDYCVDNDMYAIINIHWDGGWLENNPTFDKQEEINIKQKALWEQIAVYFRDYDEHLLFAGTNEVHKDYGTPSAENLTVQMSFNQTFVDAVRSTGGRNAWRNLIVQSYNTNIDLAVAHLKMPTDNVSNRQFAEVHFYDPYDFALQEDAGFKTQWGKDFVGKDVSSWGQEDWVDKAFGLMKTTFVDKGYPVILGEYGAILRSSLTSGLADHVKARNYYLSYITKTALANGLVPIYWDNGVSGDKGFGLFDRNNGKQLHSDAIKAITQAQ